MTLCVMSPASKLWSAGQSGPSTSQSESLLISLTTPVFNNGEFTMPPSLYLRSRVFSSSSRALTERDKALFLLRPAAYELTNASPIRSSSSVLSQIEEPVRIPMGDARCGATEVFWCPAYSTSVLLTSNPTLSLDPERRLPKPCPRCMD